jgi:putative transposase
VRTSPFYPQSNGKIERWHKSLKSESIRPRCPLSLEDARQTVTGYVEQYNTRRLHSAIGYVTPADKMAGREPEIFAARDRKLEAARQQRQVKRRAARVIPAPAEEKSLKSDSTNPTAVARVAPSRETEAGSAEEQPAEG